MNPAFASVLAGSLAGAVGVGVAFPLDTLKTKAQVMGQQRKKEKYCDVPTNTQHDDPVVSKENMPSPEMKKRMMEEHGTITIEIGTHIDEDGVVEKDTDLEILDAEQECAFISKDNDKDAYIAKPNLSMTAMVILIWKAEGASGFFNGVRGMMIGQALIKAVAFSVNTYFLTELEQQQIFALAPIVNMVVSACLSGFFASFVVTPVERIKVMMQASDKNFYKNELHCAEAVIHAEGWEGLLVRGLGATIAREVPSYAVYFVLYGYLMQTPIAMFLGGLAPLIFGALSGCASWLPVYPVDVVKTLLQNTEGKEGHVSVWGVIHDVYSEGGIAAFFDGLKPKMLRAAVNHAVTFWIYSIVIQQLIQ